MQPPMNPVDIANKVRPSVINWWNSEYKGSRVRGPSGQWKQQLKNNFTFLMRFQSPSNRQGSWTIHLQTAVNRTIQQMCPNWQVDRKHGEMYESIVKEGRRTKCPTSDWLQEKAYAWLKCLSQKPDHQGWYPVHAIAVAYELFLSGISSMPSFLKYLAKKPLPEIHTMLRAHASSVVCSPGSNNIAHNDNSNYLHVFRNDCAMNPLIVTVTTKQCTQQRCNLLLMSLGVHQPTLPITPFFAKQNLVYTPAYASAGATVQQSLTITRPAG